MNQLLMAMKNRKKGQGVVEYAGALILAGLIVAAVIAAGGDDAIATLFTTVVTDVQNQVTGLN